MDATGPQIGPSLEQIRERFDQRRAHPSARDGLLRRLLAMDAKLQQYNDGRRFVAGVVDQVGMDGFNRVWRSPENLPTYTEIGAPQQWVERVCGASAS
jgi:putative hydrolase